MLNATASFAPHGCPTEINVISFQWLPVAEKVECCLAKMSHW